jgi:hypothetical protein
MKKEYIVAYFYDEWLTEEYTNKKEALRAAKRLYKHWNGDAMVRVYLYIQGHYPEVIWRKQIQSENIK